MYFDIPYDVPKDFTVNIGQEYMGIVFGALERISTCLCSGRVSFGVDAEGFLRIVEIGPLSQEEMRSLRVMLHLEE
jgi:hypothetical protein